MNDNVQNILAERKNTHGEFADNSRIAMALISVVIQEPYFHQMTLQQQFAILNIFGKISRTISGDNNERDHYNDICGYATLALQSIPQSPGETNDNDKK